MERCAQLRAVQSINVPEKICNSLIYCQGLSALAAAYEVSHALVIFDRKADAITSGLPVRSVHVVERVSAVVALSTIEPGEVFDVGAGQSLPCGREVLLDPQQVDGRASGRGAERLPGDLAGEGMVLQVEEPSGALDVGEGFRTGHFLPLEHLAGAERPFELAHEFFQVVLYDAIERHQVAVDVIQDFSRGGLGSNEVKRGTAGEDLDIALEWRKKRNEAVG